jgi:hypothetical protein
MCQVPGMPNIGENVLREIKFKKIENNMGSV